MQADQITEQEYMQMAETLFESIESQCDEYAEELDAELQGGVITIHCEPTDTQIVVSRQISTREIWLAAKSGAFHFIWEGEQWRDTKGAGSLSTVLSSVLSQQAERKITLSA